MSDSDDFNNASFPVVGIGASAGGLDAFKKFLTAIPPKTGMAYVFIQHMNAEHESILPELLTKVTSLPVHTVSDDLSLKPDHVYVMPSGKVLTAVDGKLKVQNRDQFNKNVKIIDLFFSSLGVVHQSFAVGVVLSGTASDGTLGLKIIKAYGGITFAQDQSSAFNGMPQSAIRSGDVDFVLPPEKIPSKLIEINRPFHLTGKNEKDKEEISVHNDEILRQILFQLRARKNVDFGQYKKTTITRRIVRRMALSKINDIEEYLEFLKKNKVELDLLYDDFLISVTHFFRDPKSFEALSAKVFPALLKDRKSDEPIRIWVAGCASGQEAYSVAICILEFIKKNSPGLKVQIFATDISSLAISKARNGIYDKIEMEGLDDVQVEQYFNKLDGQYQVAKSIREICVFAYHNLLQDPPFARMDLISCRNVLIYMEPALQKKAFATFHYALKDFSYLLLGKSESPGASQAFKLYNAVAPEVKLYSKKEMNRPVIQVATRHIEEGFQMNDKRKDFKKTMPDFQKTADDLILSRYSPPGVIINEQFDIVQFRGLTGRWLEPPPGKASLNLLRMAREGLSFELRNVLHKVKQTNAPAVKEDISFVTYGRHELVTIEALPLSGDEPHYLVLFHSHNADESSSNYSTRLPATVPDIGADQKSVAELRVAQLEKELAVAREDMRSITDEQEASNEELQSANEELLSTTEELQTLNEELQTSNEEVQSTNEELQTLNQELVDRNNELNLTNHYIEAILDTIRDPIIILDKDLRVRSASKGFYIKFETTEQAVEDNLLSELKSCPWADAVLIEKLRSVLINKKSFIDYEITCQLPTAGKRFFLLNATAFERIAGDQLILISMEDITVNQSEKIFLLGRKQQLEERIKLAIEATGIGTWDYDPVLNIARYDDQCKILFGFPPGAEVSYQDFLETLDKTDRKNREKMLTKTLAGENNGLYETQYRIKTRDAGKTRWINSRGRVFFNGQGKAIRLIGTMLDITDEKMSEQLLKESEERFRMASEASLAMIWMSGPDKLRNYFNKSWLKFTGRTLAQEMGNGWAEGVFPADLNDCLEVYKSKFDRREEFYMEFRLRRHDGTYHWISDSGAPRFSPEGLFEGYIGTCLDIHDQKMSRELLEQLVQERTASLLKVNNQLKESNQNLSEFAYVASHDLQEPLRKINTFSHQLKEKSYGDQTEDVNEHLNKITQSSNRMSRLIEDLLNYARLLNPEGAKTATDLKKIVEATINDFDLQISERNVIIKVGDLPTILAIPMRMSQLFHNLFSNSLKFTPAEKQPVISIHSEKLSEAEKIKLEALNQQVDYHKITFSDNGIGFNQEFSEKIFTLFQRLNGRSEYEGTGIGLTICRKIVLNHDGIIFANSRENIGSDFYIILPEFKSKGKIQPVLDK